ncbi:MucBP domain-containing protein [Enterococcus sp. DIV0086]|uniref:MucBP domain-containing protein n=1 Tax=Enterococcus sp. DIV0086 TaxID=2774655 RepID=UPI003D2A9949
MKKKSLFLGVLLLSYFQPLYSVIASESPTSGSSSILSSSENQILKTNSDPLSNIHTVDTNNTTTDHVTNTKKDNEESINDESNLNKSDSESKDNPEKSIEEKTPNSETVSSTTETSANSDETNSKVNENQMVKPPEEAQVNKMAVTTGTWGTAPYTWDDSSGVLTIGAGDLQQVDLAPYNSGSIDKDNIKKIIFTGRVIAPVDSSNLFSLFNLSSIDGLTNLDTSNVTTMNSMFSSTTKLTSLDLSSFNTSNVTTMSYMFSSTGLISLNLSNFNTSKVTDMYSMFSTLINLTSLDLSSFNTSNVTNMGDMFSGEYSSTSLTSLNLSSFNNSKVMNMNRMFTNTVKLQSLTLGKNFKFLVSGGGNPDIPTITPNNKYTGLWKNVGTGTEDIPKGANLWNSLDFQKYYNGNTDADTYVWQQFSAPITVNYVDEKGKTILTPQILKGISGDTYDATTNKYKLDVAGYTLDTSKLPKNGTGSFTDKEQTVTYVYKANTGGAAVTVNYVDEKGKTILTPQILKGNIGDTYDATTNKYKLDVAGYTLDISKLPKNGTGSFTDKEQTVTYVYKANAEGAVITVNYVDEKGKTIHDPQILKGNIGDTYDATTNKYKLDVAGYTLDTSKLPKNGTGSFTDKEQTVTYVYKANAEGAVITVNYVDEKGKTIHDPQILKGNIGDTYDATTNKYKLDVAGYTLDTSKLPKNGTGIFTDKEQTVTYVYKANAEGAVITVNYVDEKGKTIHDPQILKGNIGDTYDATTNKYKLDVAGYTLDTSKLPKNGTGSFTDKEQTVTYVYKANAEGAVITVNYVDEKGKTIHDPQILKGNIGDTYDATTNKYKLDVAGYTLDTSKLPKNGTGSFTDKEQTVTYVYKNNSIIPNSKSNNQNKDVFTNYEGKTTVNNKKYLPHTGEDKISAFVTLVLGYFILIGTTFILIYKRKKQNKK